MHKPSERTEAVVDDNHHDALPHDKSREIVGAFMSGDVTTAMDPQHNWQTLGT